MKTHILASRRALAAKKQQDTEIKPEPVTWQEPLIEQLHAALSNVASAREEVQEALARIMVPGSQELQSPVKEVLIRSSLSAMLTMSDISLHSVQHSLSGSLIQLVEETIPVALDQYENPSA